MEICLDCKDKLVKFYHFKRKAKEIQKRRLQASRIRTSKKEKQSKVVHSIVQIVQNYTEKCSISSIRVDESQKKLIIEPEAVESPATISGPLVQPQVIPNKQEFPFEAEYISEGSLNAVVIKQEPGLMIEENSNYDDESMLELHREEDEKDFSAGETSQQYYGEDSSEPSTSTGQGTLRRRSRSQPNEGESKNPDRNPIFVSIDGEFFVEIVIKNAPCRCEKSENPEKTNCWRCWRHLPLPPPRQTTSRERKATRPATGK
jgi:hypothetical protein